MASAVPLTSKLHAGDWLARSAPPLDKLNDHLDVLPTLFRVLAACFFLPVAALALADLIGWAFFKLVLRPLGYASTIRFKDPEPPAFISSTTGHDGSIPSSSSSSEASTSPVSSPASTTASLPAIDELDPPAAPRARTRSTSSSRRRMTRPRSASSASDASDPDHGGSTASKLMNRHRAPSVGFDGPLFGGDTTDGEGQTPSYEGNPTSDYFDDSDANATATASGSSVHKGPPPVGPRRTSTLQPSLSFTKAKDD
ncbi:hypothetical protein JCM10212_002250 [Sporobolomyces blumeae]